MLRTFSKAHGLAGLRVGWGYFPPNIAAAVNGIVPLNNINAIGLVAATAAIGDRNHVLLMREQNSALREDFRHRLRQLGFSPHPSRGNFLLVPFATAAASSYAFLKARNILVRPMAAYGLDDFLRVRIGAADELDAVCTALADWRHT
jgi:histidinol-phosphate/aromatic aminotransferase/cobyric acid decarboxylase-like protein